MSKAVNIEGLTQARRRRLAHREVVLALDMGLDCGWALGLLADSVEPPRRRIPVSGTVNLREDAHQGGGIRYLRLRRFLLEMESALGAAGATLAAMVWERAMPVKKGHHATMTANGMQAIAACRAEETGIPWLALSVSRVRTQVFGAQLDKPGAVAAVRAMGFRPRSDDEADAIAVALAATAELAPLPPAGTPPELHAVCAKCRAIVRPVSCT